MKKRDKKHPEYYAINAYMILAKQTDSDCAKMLKISERTYKDKIKGYSDFSAEQGKMLATFLNVTQEQLFLV